MRASRSAAADWLARTDAAGLLYGAIVSASVLGTASVHADHFESVALATAAVLVVYWLAHVYIAAQALSIDGDRRHVLQRGAAAAGHEAGVLKGGLPAVVVYVVVKLAGLDVDQAAEVAVYFSVALLVGVGYLAAHRSGRSGLAALVDAGVAGLFGLVVVAAKALLH
jgi:hypothetical protein